MQNVFWPRDLAAAHVLHVPTTGPAQAPADAPTKLHAARAIAEENTQARGVTVLLHAVQHLRQIVVVFAWLALPGGPATC